MIVFAKPFRSKAVLLHYIWPCVWYCSTFFGLTPSLYRTVHIDRRRQ